jgi:hypothetical protein
MSSRNQGSFGLDNSTFVGSALKNPADPTVEWVSREILLRPRRYLVGRWNWKSALVSAIVRSAMFFRAVLGAAPPAALSASLVEFVLAFALAGFGGALAQSYRRAQPRWLAISVASFVPPAVWHGSEFVVHFILGTPNLHVGMALSMLYSVVATLTTVTLMRHGLWLSGDERPVR